MPAAGWRKIIRAVLPNGDAEARSHVVRTMDVMVATKTNAICIFATLFAVLRFPFLLHSLWFRDDARDDYDGDDAEDDDKHDKSDNDGDYKIICCCCFSSSCCCCNTTSKSGRVISTVLVTKLRTFR